MDLLSQGIEACRNKEFEKAISLFDAILEKSENEDALYNRAKAYVKLQKVDQALSDFERLIQVQPDNPTFVGDYAVALHIVNKNKAAAIQFDKAIELAPDNPYSYSSRAFFRDRIGELELAIEDYDKAIELDPEDAIAYNNKGLVEEKLGYKDKAKQSFDQSNELVGYEPKNVEKPYISASNEDSKESQPKARIEIIKSVFTKEGFKDFMVFLASPFKGWK